MSSTSETGHAKNVANFEDLLASITGIGAAYNPAKAGLKLVAMQTQLTAAKAAIAALDSAMPTYVMAVDAREAAFAPLNKTVTRVVNMFRVSVSNPAETETVVSLQKKIHGTIKPVHVTATAATAPADTDSISATAATDFETAAATPLAAATRTVSTSRRSFDMQIQHLDQLIKMLSANAAYAPNEADLKVTGLNVLLADLRTKSAAVTIAENTVFNARLNRDKLLYTPGSGLVPTAADVKTYVKALFGNTSPQVKHVQSLAFKRRRM